MAETESTVARRSEVMWQLSRLSSRGVENPQVAAASGVSNTGQGDDVQAKTTSTVGMTARSA